MRRWLHRRIDAWLRDEHARVWRGVVRAGHPIPRCPVCGMPSTWVTRCWAEGGDASALHVRRYTSCGHTIRFSDEASA